MATITVPAPKIEVGDRINGRTVRAVTGRKARTVSTIRMTEHLRRISRVRECSAKGSRAQTRRHTIREVLLPQ